MRCLYSGAWCGLQRDPRTRALHHLCDVNPNHIDITTPNGYRTYREVPVGYRLHRRSLADEDMTLLEGLPIVTPARAIADGIEIGLRQTLIDQAIETAAREVLITRATAERLRAAR